MKFENDMLYLSLCALNDIKPDIKRIEKIDLDVLFESCQSQNITALVCCALEMVIKPPHKWLEAKGKAIRKNLLFDIERQQITDFMNKNGVKYLPLKGIVLKGYYPKTGMRQMSDNDIYYDEAYREQLKDFMLSKGYELISSDDHHDMYKKQPIYNFEMHHSIFGEDTHIQLHKYYLDIDKLMKRDLTTTSGYRLSNEDFYIYIIAHEYKHYATQGTGIRSLLDCYVLLNRFKGELNWDYIKRETDKLEITDFEEKQREICKKLLDYFDKVDFTKEEVEMLKYFTDCGVYGNSDTYIVNNLIGEVGNSNRKITLGMKVKYVLRRIFPPVDFYRVYYPFFYRHKYLIPICFFYRIFKALFKRKEYINTELEVLKRK